MKQSTADLPAYHLEIPGIDVRISEDSETGHAPGALSHSVFEVAFADPIRTQLSDPRSPL